MEPVTDYRPPFYLGNKFIDGQSREFEIIETHWGLPGKEPTGVGYTIELANGYKINYADGPNESVLKKVSFKQIGNPSAKVSTQPVDTMKQLIDEHKIVMR